MWHRTKSSGFGARHLRVGILASSPSTHITWSGLHHPSEAPLLSGLVHLSQRVSGASDEIADVNMLQSPRLIVTAIYILLSVWWGSKPSACAGREGGEGREGRDGSSYKLNSKDTESGVCEEAQRKLFRSMLP